MLIDILSIMGSTAAIYIMVVVGIRILGKKELGELSITDLIFVMLISEAVGDVMRSSNDTLLGAFVAAATLVLLNRIFNVLLYRSEKFRRVVDGTPVILIRHGRPNHKEMKRNRITLEDLEEAGRQNGKGDISTISLAILEVDGKISILEDSTLRTKTPLIE